MEEKKRRFGWMAYPPALEELVVKVADQLLPFPGQIPFREFSPRELELEPPFQLFERFKAGGLSHSNPHLLREPVPPSCGIPPENLRGPRL